MIAVISFFFKLKNQIEHNYLRKQWFYSNITVFCFVVKDNTDQFSFGATKMWSRLEEWYLNFFQLILMESCWLGQHNNNNL